jgi:hypothetical protein
MTGQSPVIVAGGTIYAFTLFIVMVIAIISGWGRDYEGSNRESLKQKK